MKKEPTSRRLCVDAVGKTFEMDLSLLEVIHQINQAFHAASEPSTDPYWSLRYFNHPERFADCPSGLYSFARFQSNSGQALVVAANFRPGSDIDGRLRIPRELSAAVHFQQKVVIEMVLSREGAASAVIATVTPNELESSGFRISIPNQTSQVYLLRPSHA